MRLWHQSLIPKLPRQQLLGKHREICALRGNGWGKKHATVDYVFTHTFQHLVAFHYLVMNEMKSRGYQVDDAWDDPMYRGKSCVPVVLVSSAQYIYPRVLSDACSYTGYIIYPEHTDEYLRECVENLKAKGVDIE